MIDTLQNVCAIANDITKLTDEDFCELIKTAKSYTSEELKLMENNFQRASGLLHGFEVYCRVAYIEKHVEKLNNEQI